MLRIVLFLLLIALAAVGATWVADQTGEVVLNWDGWRVTATIPVFVLGLGIITAAAVILWSILRGVWRTPARIKRRRRERRHARGRHAITHGLLAIGHSDSTTARRHAEAARRLAPDDPLALLLHAQSAQLEGNREEAQRAFRAMTEREDTRLLGLRGLFIEAQRRDDPVAAILAAEEAIKFAPGSTWASQAVLGFRCAKSDWSGALAILNSNLSAQLIDKSTYRRQRGVLLTARALELEHTDRNASRESVMEAVKLAPTLVPAAVLAARFESEAHQVRRAMKIVETAWLAHPHPDLAEAYAHVKLGDSARQRLQRTETLATKTPGNIEGALALARAAIDASEFKRAREALAPFVSDPTQRVAMLMSEIERTEHGDSGRARAWTLRAIRARLDPVWTADGYVSDRWRPVSPVTGRLDAFQWQPPVASLPSDRGATIDSTAFEEAEAILAAPPPQLVNRGGEDLAEPPEEAEPEAPTVAQDDSPPAAKTVEPPAEPAKPVSSPTQSSPAAVAPLFRDRADLGKVDARLAPAVIPIIHPPDDPGVDDDGPSDEFVEQIGTPRAKSKAQPGGWRGFWSRWGG